MQDLSKASNKKPKDATVKYNLGLSYFLMRNYQKACEQYSEAIKIEPKPLYLRHRGMTWYELGELKNALKDLDLAISKAQSESSFYFDRGNVYLKMKECTLAITDYEIAMKLDPTNVMYSHQMGIAY